MNRPNARHDEAEEALQAALAESMQPDYMATILRAEAAQAHEAVRDGENAQHQQQRARIASVASSASPQLKRQSPQVRAANDNQMEHFEALFEDQLRLNDPQEMQLQKELHEKASAVALNHLHLDDRPHKVPHRKSSTSITLEPSNQDEHEQDDTDDQENPNASHPMLGFDDLLLHHLMRFLDEDSIGNCICCCKRLYAVCASEKMFETLCRRVFGSQNPKFAALLCHQRRPFALRRFDSWTQMFLQRPRVCYNGFYWLKTSYLKKPEVNMWTEVRFGDILEVVYYRYFAFQRDGSVLYATLIKPPQEVGRLLRERKNKHVCCGRFHVEKRQVFVSVPTCHNAVEFVFEIDPRHPNNRFLTLKDHFAFSEPDGSGWIDYFDTYDEELRFYRYWDL